MMALVQMSGTDQSERREVQRALKDLGTRTAANLQAFNDTVPYASWLRRSEMAHFTDDLLSAAKWAPQRRRPTPLGHIQIAFSWITRARTDYMPDSGSQAVRLLPTVAPIKHIHAESLREKPVEMSWLLDIAIMFAVTSGVVLWSAIIYTVLGRLL